jgi:hypothetical protein
VRERSFEHVGDNFHIAVRMGWETSAGNNSVFVDHSKSTETHILSVIVIAKRKSVAAVEPAKFRRSPILASSQHYHF